MHTHDGRHAELPGENRQVRQRPAGFGHESCEAGQPGRKTRL
jgi:hypothetical protein